MTTPPEGYRYYTPMSIRYGDMDSLGHVNNAKYLTYLEQARVGYFHDQQIWNGDPTELGLIVAKVIVEYKLPLTMSDGVIDIWTRVSRLGNKSFDIEQQIIRPRDGVVAATGITVGVVYNYRTNETVSLPDDWRERLITYEPGLNG